MSVIAHDDVVALNNPLDVVEEIVSRNEWTFDRQGDDELSVCVAGSWCDYHLGFSFSDSHGALQIACAYDMRVPEKKRGEIHSLLAMVNERMWLGHFDVWTDEGVPMFRHAILVRGGQGPSAAQMEEMIEVAIGECERFYPAFQFVLWGGKTADEAIEAAMLETVGEA
jgi:hypothetical protein